MNILDFSDTDNLDFIKPRLVKFLESSIFEKLTQEQQILRDHYIFLIILSRTLCSLGFSKKFKFEILFDPETASAIIFQQPDKLGWKTKDQIGKILTTIPIHIESIGEKSGVKFDTEALLNCCNAIKIALNIY